MPFQFNGKTPSFGSKSDAPNPFSFGTTTTTPSPLRAFGATPSFGSASTWSQSSPFDTSFSQPQASVKQTLADAKSNGRADSPEKTSTWSSVTGDRLSRSLERIKVERPAILLADKASDAILFTYLSKLGVDGGSKRDCLAKLTGALNEVAESCPEAMKFLRHVFERASTAAAPTAKSFDREFKLREEAGEVPDEAPDAYHDILPGTSLYNTCMSAINNQLGADVGPSSPYFHRRSYRDLGADVTELIATGASRAVVRQFLRTGAHGRFTPSANVPRDVDQMVDKIFESVLEVKKQFRDGLKPKGRDDASYFSKALDSEKPKATIPPPETNHGNGKKEYYCCPYDDELLHEPPPEHPFRLMDLPPEIRNIVYREALGSGAICLMSCSHLQPRGISPGLAPQLLATCKQIHEEAQGLLVANTFMITFMPYSFSDRHPALHPHQLPHHVTSKIEHMVLLVDCIRFAEISCDPECLQAFIALKTLRIVGVEEEAEEHAISPAGLASILEEIVVRIPSNCVIDYGSRPDREQWFAKRMSDALKGKRRHHHTTDDPVGEVKEVQVAKLREAAQALSDEVVQGSKSGQPPSRRRLPGELMGMPSMRG